VHVRVARRIADLQKQRHPLVQRRAPRLVVRQEILAVDVLHRHVGPAGARDAAVVQPRDAGVIELGEDLAFRLEALGAAAQLRPKQLERYALAESALDALREEDLAHAARAQRPHDAKGADGGIGRRFGRLAGRFGLRPDRRALEETAAGVRQRYQVLLALAQRRLGDAGLTQKPVAIRQRQVERAVQQPFDPTFERDRGHVIEDTPASACVSGFGSLLRIPSGETSMKHVGARSILTGSLVVAVSVVAAGWVRAAGPVYDVNSPFDYVDAAFNGICDTGGICNGVPCCTLRAALMEANLLGSSEEVTINLPAGTYHLNIPIGAQDGHANGDLNVLEFVKVRIAGVGPDLSIIDASQLQDRAIAVEYGAVLTLSDLRIQGGRPPVGTGRIGGGVGGGIYNGRGNVTLLRCLVRDNQTTGGQHGGGIYSDQGSLTLLDSVVRVNAGYSGGGIFSSGATTSIVRSTVNGNATGAGGYGGGVYQYQGNMTIVNSTISSNAANHGGGLSVNGVSSASPTALSNVTMADNTTSGAYPAGSQAFFADSSVVLSNSMFHNGDLGCEAATVTSNGYNMIASPGNCSIIGSWISGDPPFSGALAPLGSNGGVTATQALAPNSYAVDAGDPAGCVDPLGLGSTLTTDQRGVKRPIGARCDLGAFEVEPIGDANGDGVVDVADVFYLVNFLFAGGPVPKGRANVDGIAGITVADVFYLINFLFAGGKPPV
jgi:hypothetical protein